MFPSKHTIARLAARVAVAASLAALAVPAALGGTNPNRGHDQWFNYAVSLNSNSTVPFISDTLAPGGRSTPLQGARLITDTLAPGGHSAPHRRYRLITDTLAPGGGAIVASAPAARGFDWGDAGIGAAGLTLVLLGLARMLTHRGRVVEA